MRGNVASSFWGYTYNMAQLAGALILLIGLSGASFADETTQTDNEDTHLRQRFENLVVRKKLTKRNPVNTLSMRQEKQGDAARRRCRTAAQWSLKPIPSESERLPSRARL